MQTHNIRNQIHGKITPILQLHSRLATKRKFIRNNCNHIRGKVIPSLQLHGSLAIKHIRCINHSYTNRNQRNIPSRSHNRISSLTTNRNTNSIY